MINNAKGVIQDFENKLEEKDKELHHKDQLLEKQKQLYNDEILKHSVQ